MKPKHARGKVEDLENVLLQVAELEAKSSQQQIETLEACVALLEKHGIGGAKKKKRTRS
jgi:hypothetical protein